MNLNYLIEQLTIIRDDELANGTDPNEVEVRLAIQPRWAFEHELGDVVLVDMNEPDEDDEEDMSAANAKEPKYIVYIGEGSQIGYLPGKASTELGFGR